MVGSIRMTVDESELETVIRSLNTDMVSRMVIANKIRPILRTMRKIMRKKDGSMPLDPDTQQPMTAARRKAIYDACIGPAYEILGLNGDGTPRNT